MEDRVASLEKKMASLQGEIMKLSASVSSMHDLKAKLKQLLHQKTQLSPPYPSTPALPHPNNTHHTAPSSFTTSTTIPSLADLKESLKEWLTKNQSPSHQPILAVQQQLPNLVTSNLIQQDNTSFLPQVKNTTHPAFTISTTPQTSIPKLTSSLTVGTIPVLPKEDGKQVLMQDVAYPLQLKLIFVSSTTVLAADIDVVIPWRKSFFAFNRQVTMIYFKIYQLGIFNYFGLDLLIHYLGPHSRPDPDPPNRILFPHVHDGQYFLIPSHDTLLIFNGLDGAYGGMITMLGGFVLADSAEFYGLFAWGVTEFVQLLIFCSPTWMLAVNMDVFTWLGKSLRQWHEDDLALALLGMGAVALSMKFCYKRMDSCRGTEHSGFFID